jgi:hypothetical protein
MRYGGRLLLKDREEGGLIVSMAFPVLVKH